MTQQRTLNDKDPDHDPLLPSPGDVISARFRWSQDQDDTPGEKIRPCLIVKAAADGSSIIIAPISTLPTWKAGECVEISPDDRPAAGLHDNKRSWIKLTEINKIDLPNLAVIPHVHPDGRMSWRRGRVSDAVFKQVTEEIGRRLHDKTLKGRHVAADANLSLRIAAVQKIQSDQDTTAANRSSELARKGAAVARARAEAAKGPEAPEAKPQNPGRNSAR